MRPPDAQDLTLVYALLAFVAGLIAGNLTAARKPPPD